MPDHRDLTDTDGLHEPKGITSAALGQIYVANGAGGGTWTTSLQQSPDILQFDFAPTSAVTVASSNSAVQVDSTYGTWTAGLNTSSTLTLNVDGRVTASADGYYQVNITAIVSPDTLLGGVNEQSALQVWDTLTQPADDDKDSIQFTLESDIEAREPLSINYSSVHQLYSGDFLEFYHIGLDNARNMWYDRINVSIVKVSN